MKVRDFLRSPGAVASALAIMSAPSVQAEIDTEVEKLRSEGYTVIELEPHDGDPLRDRIHSDFVTPAYAEMSQFMDPPTAFKFAFHDLDADGHDELVISVEYACDMDGCRLLAYSTDDGDTWDKILDTYGMTIAAPPASDGEFPRLTVLSPEFNHYYEHNGAAYIAAAP